MDIADNLFAAEIEIKPTEVSSVDLENLCRIIQEKLFDIPTNPRSLLSDLEVCIGGSDCITSESASVAEISLSEEMIVVIGGWLGNQERVGTLVSSTCDSAGVYGEELSEQLVRDVATRRRPLPCRCFGHLERNRDSMGIAEYSISQSTLETIFNHFAVNS